MFDVNSNLVKSINQLKVEDSDSKFYQEKYN